MFRETSNKQPPERAPQGSSAWSEVPQSRPRPLDNKASKESTSASQRSSQVGTAARARTNNLVCGEMISISKVWRSESQRRSKSGAGHWGSIELSKASENSGKSHLASDCIRADFEGGGSPAISSSYEASKGKQWTKVQVRSSPIVQCVFLNGMLPHAVCVNVTTTFSIMSEHLLTTAMSGRRAKRLCAYRWFPGIPLQHTTRKLTQRARTSAVLHLHGNSNCLWKDVLVVFNLLIPHRSAQTK